MLQRHARLETFANGLQVLYHAGNNDRGEFCRLTTAVLIDGHYLQSITDYQNSRECLAALQTVTAATARDFIVTAKKQIERG